MVTEMPLFNISLKQVPYHPFGEGVEHNINERPCLRENLCDVKGNKDFSHLQMMRLMLRNGEYGSTLDVLELEPNISNSSSSASFTMPS